MQQGRASVGQSGLWASTVTELGCGEDIPPQEPSVRPSRASHPEEGALLGTDQQRADKAVPS